MSLARRVFTIGRDPGCDLPLGDDSVSRYHAELVDLGDGTYRLTDRDSRNGTYLISEGRRELRISEGLVGPRDRVRFGSAALGVSDLIAALKQRVGAAPEPAARPAAGPPPLPPPVPLPLPAAADARPAGVADRHLEIDNALEGYLKGYGVVTLLESKTAMQVVSPFFHGSDFLVVIAMVIAIEVALLGLVYFAAVVRRSVLGTGTLAILSGLGLLGSLADLEGSGWSGDWISTLLSLIGTVLLFFIWSSCRDYRRLQP